jgi:DNA-binding NtrC family response regulator
MNIPIPRVLVIEDDPDGLKSICEAIQDAGYAVATAATGAEGLAAAKREQVDVVLSDLVLPDMDGLKVLEGIHACKDALPILIMTAYGSVDTAVRAIKSGAYDYLVKPLDLEDVQAKLGRAIEASQLRAQVARLRSEVRDKYSVRSMVAGSPAMADVLRQIEAVAGTNATVLVLGESGTGKELVARALHADGKRSTGPFVAVNCGAFAESLLESEMFGHEKGSFTGASMRHEGAFERANGGTLFLDEIGIAPKSVQTRLLRALEQKEVLRVGGREPIPIDARIVAASNRDLDELVEAGEFRQDLLYRLQVITLRLPPLRARREDIRELTNRFVAAACAEHGRYIETVDSACYERLEQHEWPGNIRELRNVVESAVIMAPGPVLKGDDLRFGRGESGNRNTLVMPEGMTLADLEREALLRALQRHAGNRQLTADELGISTRTIQRKIREYDLPF